MDKEPKSVPTKGYIEGGPVEGPAGPDAVPAQLTNGEYVLPPDIVGYLGVQALDQLVEQTRNAIMRRAQPPMQNEWMDLFSDDDNPPTNEEPVEKPNGGTSTPAPKQRPE